MNILFFADVFGQPGRNLIRRYVQQYRQKFQADVCIANCENIASGRGITEKTCEELFDGGVDILTSGNHLWDKKESFDYLAIENRICKPLNYPEKAIGKNYFIKNLPNGDKLLVVTLVGQAFMNVANSPFTILEQYLPEFRKITNKIFVDFHAESTAEKRTMGFAFDGKVSAIIGTHTHIQTADEEILPMGTAYLTDAGMTGPHDSVIGIRKNIIIDKMLTGMPSKYEVAETGLELNGVFIRLDDTSGKALEIKRIKDRVV